MNKLTLFIISLFTLFWLGNLMVVPYSEAQPPRILYLPGSEHNIALSIEVTPADGNYDISLTPESGLESLPLDVSPGLYVADVKIDAALANYNLGITWNTRDVELFLLFSFSTEGELQLPLNLSYEEDEGDELSAIRAIKPTTTNKHLQRLIRSQALHSHILKTRPNLVSYDSHGKIMRKSDILLECETYWFRSASWLSGHEPDIFRMDETIESIMKTSLVSLDSYPEFAEQFKKFNPRTSYIRGTILQADVSPFALLANVGKLAREDVAKAIELNSALKIIYHSSTEREQMAIGQYYKIDGTYLSQRHQYLLSLHPANMDMQHMN